VIRRAHHLSDDQLLDCYLHERDGTALDSGLAAHLAGCSPCRVRQTDLTRLMQNLVAEAERESDAIFTPERLRVQQQRIARRLDHVSRSGRILSFPSRLVNRTVGARTVRVAPRWMAAAAAAGLFVGVALGTSYRSDNTPRTAIVDSTGVRPAQQQAPVVTRANTASEFAADDAFLTELEMALDRPHTRELLAIDALTPHFREIRTAQ
jgi:hypothetical protein